MRRAVASALSVAKHDTLDGFSGAYELQGILDTKVGWIAEIVPEGTQKALAPRESSLADIVSITHVKL